METISLALLTVNSYLRKLASFRPNSHDENVDFRSIFLCLRLLPNKKELLVTIDNNRTNIKEKDVSLQPD